MLSKKKLCKRADVLTTTITVIHILNQNVIVQFITIRFFFFIWTEGYTKGSNQNESKDTRRISYIPKQN